jgi:hypothetical protein
MKNLIIFLLLILISIASTGCIKGKLNNSTEYADDKFKPNQVWKYNTRNGEENSLITILKVEQDDKQGVIVHIAVDELHINGINGKEQNEITHLPFSKEALLNSVTELIDKNVNDLPEYREGYEQWKEAFDMGKAGIWSITVNEAIDSIEQAIQQ